MVLTDGVVKHQNWFLEIMKNKFEMQVTEPPLLIKYTPDQTGLENCKEFGKKIAERLMHVT